MGPHPIASEDLVAIVDRAVLPAGREIDLPVHRSRRYVVIEGAVLLVETSEVCTRGAVLDPTGGRLVLRAVSRVVLGVVDAAGR